MTQDSEREQPMGVVRLVAIREVAVSLDEVLAAVQDRSAGGVVSFAGYVRATDGGREVNELEYVAHPDALMEGGKLTVMNPVNIDAVRVEPFKMFDNVYYVGIRHVSTYLITTSEGLVLLDTSLPETTELMLDNIRKVGFKPEDIKYVQCPSLTVSPTAIAVP